MNWNLSDRDWQISKSSLRERFKELLLLSQWTDCTFLVGERKCEIKCHKLVLSVSSPVFEALFFGGLSKKSDEPIRVPDIDAGTFRTLLMYLYSDSLKLGRVDDAGRLLYAAKKYLIPQLGRLCLEYLLDRTCIQTLWEVLAIGESLDEEELIEAVLKIMCRFRTHVWYNKSEKLSLSMIKRLLNEPSMNMSEEELWLIVLDWAKDDCAARGMTPIGRNIREALIREKLLEKIRFLIFSSENFRKHVLETDILTEKEIDSIAKVIDADEFQIKTKDTKESISIVDYEVPPLGLCPLKKKRRKVSRVIWRCTREKIKGDTMWICCDQFICSVISERLVLVTGLEVPTRSIYSARECYPWLGSLQHPTGTYNERFNVIITDRDGTALVSTSYDSWVPYDSVQVINLDEEVWFKAGHEYFIIFELSSGSYDLYNLAHNVPSKGTVFTFKDSSDHSRSGIFCGSFVSSILYCL
ncbi:hypothetical protein O3M35_005121 [Rhynocoris fuscipes]|uniref:BTB domain-containing protein n=1 Tax=Rhynocoris fuscipes TaxID=488301 RepID=A0AAW1DHX4_9HEMI